MTLQLARVWSLWARYGHWLWLIAVVTVVSGGVSYAVSRSIPPEYRAIATLLVNQVQGSGGGASYTDIMTSERLARTYGELMRKRPVLEKTITELQLATTNEQLARTIEVRPVRDTQLVTVSVENRDPRLAADIANTVVRTFIAQVVDEQLGQTTSTKQVLQQQIVEMERQIRGATDGMERERRTGGEQSASRIAVLQSDLGQYQATFAQLLRSQQEMTLSETRAMNAVRLAEAAIEPALPVRPQVGLNTIVAAIVGLILAAGFVVLVEYIDDTVRTPEAVESATGLHTLGAVALVPETDSIPGSDRLRLVADTETKSPVAESFRILRTNVEFAQVDRACRKLMITSPSQGEGKSTIAVNFAAVVAQTGKRVLLVDCDLRRPSLHRTFRWENQQGLTNLLVRGNVDWHAVTRQSAIPNLSVILSGPVPPNPSELLGSSRFASVIDELASEFDLVILDTPPTIAVSDPMVMAPVADGVIVVVDAGRTSADLLRRTRDSLQRAGANVLGVVLNKLTERSGAYYYRYYYAYYGEDQHGAKKSRRRRPRILRALGIGGR